MKDLFGETSDELHIFYVKLQATIFRHETTTMYSNLLRNMFVEHFCKKFDDTSKIENLDAQIFYYTQQIRREVSSYNRMQALSHIPKLINLLKMRTSKAKDEKDANFWSFRLGITL